MKLHLMNYLSDFLHISNYLSFISDKVRKLIGLNVPPGVCAVFQSGSIIYKCALTGVHIFQYIARERIRRVVLQV